MNTINVIKLCADEDIGNGSFVYLNRESGKVNSLDAGTGRCVSALGISARKIEKGETIKISLHGNTEDVISKGSITFAIPGESAKNLLSPEYYTE